MRVRSGKAGRPKRVEDDPAFAPLLAEIETAEAEVLAAVRAMEATPTQAATKRLLDAQLVVASRRAHLARQCRDDKTAQLETANVIKLAAARDDAVARLWGDELDKIHEMVTRVGGLQATIAAELAAELDEEDNDAERQTDTGEEAR